MKKTAAGIWLLTELPGQGLVALAQRRGTFNHEVLEDNNKPVEDITADDYVESRPGGLQPTAWGGLRKNETALGAVAREVKEELGKVLREWLEERLSNQETEIPLVYQQDNENKMVVTYAAKIPWQLIPEIQLGPSSGGLERITPKDIDSIENLNDFDKTRGVVDHRVLAMFPDAKEALIEAFKIFSNSR